MRVSIEWLKEFVDLKENPDSLADMLSMLGLEAEVVHDFPSLSKVETITPELAFLIV